MRKYKTLIFCIAFKKKFQHPISILRSHSQTHLRWSHSDLMQRKIHISKAHSTHRFSTWHFSKKRHTTHIQHINPSFWKSRNLSRRFHGILLCNPNGTYPWHFVFALVVYAIIKNLFVILKKWPESFFTFTRQFYLKRWKFFPLWIHRFIVY